MPWLPWSFARASCYEEIPTPIHKGFLDCGMLARALLAGTVGAQYARLCDGIAIQEHGDEHSAYNRPAT